MENVRLMEAQAGSESQGQDLAESVGLGHRVWSTADAGYEIRMCGL